MTSSCTAERRDVLLGISASISAFAARAFCEGARGYDDVGVGGGSGEGFCGGETDAGVGAGNEDDSGGHIWDHVDSRFLMLFVK